MKGQSLSAVIEPHAVDQDAFRARKEVSKNFRVVSPFLIVKMHVQSKMVFFHAFFEVSHFYCSLCVSQIAFFSFSRSFNFTSCFFFLLFSFFFRTARASAPSAKNALLGQNIRLDYLQIWRQTFSKRFVLNILCRCSKAIFTYEICRKLWII